MNGFRKVEFENLSAKKADFKFELVWFRKFQMKFCEYNVFSHSLVNDTWSKSRKYLNSRNYVWYPKIFVNQYSSIYVMVGSKGSELGTLLY